MENEKKQLNIELRPEIAKGSYANLAIITHSRSEFILDFATVLPGIPKPEVGNRIVMTPEHAKRLLNALADNVSKYEANFGPIDLGGPKGTFNLADFQNNGTKS
ncbi:MAG: DUF3467 domain-containing protein [Bacteroidales bacterium]|nr:DUF3467 domain-containing protein [Bacteroidales bacterium]